MAEGAISIYNICANSYFRHSTVKITNQNHVCSHNYCVYSPQHLERLFKMVNGKIPVPRALMIKTKYVNTCTPGPHDQNQVCKYLYPGPS